MQLALTTDSGVIRLDLTACEFCHDFDPWSIRVRCQLPTNASPELDEIIAKRLELHIMNEGVFLQYRESADGLVYQAVPAPGAIPNPGEFAFFDDLTPPDKVELRCAGEKGGSFGWITVQNRCFLPPGLRDDTSSNNRANFNGRYTAIAGPTNSTVRSSNNDRLVIKASSTAMRVCVLLIVCGIGLLNLCAAAIIGLGAEPLILIVFGLVGAFGLWSLVVGVFRLCCPITVVIDRRKQTLSLKWLTFLQLVPWSFDLNQAASVEAVRGRQYRMSLPSIQGGGEDAFGNVDRYWIGEEDGGVEAVYAWELNIVMKSFARVNLCNQPGSTEVIDMGRQVAEFLKLPLNVRPTVGK